MDHLEGSFVGETHAVAKIYFSYKGQQDISLAGLFGSILQQILHQIPRFPHGLKEIYEERKYKQQTLSSTECLDFIKAVALEVAAIKAVAQASTNIFLAIDALDECPEGIRGPFLNGLRSLPPTIQLFFTSRHVGSIKDAFSKVECLDICASQSDIRSYLRGRLSTETRLLHMIQNEPALYEIIVTKIAEQANGMYVIAKGGLSFY